MSTCVRKQASSWTVFLFYGRTFSNVGETFWVTAAALTATTSSSSISPGKKAAIFGAVTGAAIFTRFTYLVRALSLFYLDTHAHARTRTHTHAHARTRTQARTHVHTYSTHAHAHVHPHPHPHAHAHVASRPHTALLLSLKHALTLRFSDDGV